MKCPSFLHGVGKITYCVGILAILLFVVGAVLFGCAWLIEDEIKMVVNDGIYANVIVDAFDANGYQAWANNYDHDHAILYQEFYLYNITNINDLVNGASEITFNLMGPYTYIAIHQKIDVSFPDDGNQVQYLTWQRWLFQPQLSCAGCKETDVVHNINPAYIGALAQTGGELELLAALTGPVLKAQIFEFFWGPFTQDFLGQWRVPILIDAKQALIANRTNTQEYFYSNWANATQPASPLWNGLLVSALEGTPSNISLASAEGLWNPSLQLSLLDTSLASVKVWRKALYNDTQALAQLREAFSLTGPQLSAVINWLNASCNPTLVYPNFTKSFNLGSVEDAAYLQWGQGVLTKGVSVETLYPEMNFPTIPEINIWYAAYGDPFASLDVEASKMLLAGPYGLFNALNLKLYTDALAKGEFSLIQQNWGIDGGDVLMTSIYFSFITTFWATPTLKSLVASGNGLFTNRTVHQWLWDVHDPVISMLSPDASQVALIVNETSPDMTRQRHQPDLCYTGKSDINKIGQYIKWEGQTELVDAYTTPIPVEGSNDAGQFVPGLDMSVKLYNFDDNYERRLELLPMYYLDIKGVKALRYEINNDTWEPSYTYDQPYQGFANMTGSHKGATVFLSNAHMYLCDPNYVAKVKGLKEVQNVTFDTIMVDIEPITGAVIHYTEALQVNVYLDPKHAGWFNFFGFEGKLDIFYPVMIAAEYSTLTDADANKIKDNLYFGIRMENTMFWVAFGVGLGFFVLSLPLIAFFAWRYRKERRAHSGGYSFVHDQDTINE